LVQSIRSRKILLKLTSPGVPDIYQGNEIWDYSLVDPDNRRPVDYKRRREMLESLAAANVRDLVRDWPDGRIKNVSNAARLAISAEHTALFQHGEICHSRRAAHCRMRVALLETS